MAQVKGKVAQIIGPVVDVSFDTSVAPLPNIYDSLEISKDDGSKLVLEVQSHIGEDQVRTISMDSTDDYSVVQCCRHWESNSNANWWGSQR